MATYTATGGAAVEAVLASDAFAVPEAPPGDTGMAWFRASVSRFANGADHARRRARAVAELAALSPPGLRRSAEARTEDALAAAAGGSLDLMPLARRVPVAALAAELGAREGAARIALLVQACDATAALIGNAVAAALHDGRPPEVDELLAETVRCDPPVRTTRRLCTAPATVAGLEVARGDVVVVDLASAGLTFGAGRRPCPGREQALALAAGVVAPVLRRCVLAPGALRWAESPNLHVLERLDVEVA